MILVVNNFISLFYFVKYSRLKKLYQLNKEIFRKIRNVYPFKKRIVFER